MGLDETKIPFLLEQWRSQLSRDVEVYLTELIQNLNRALAQKEINRYETRMDALKAREMQLLAYKRFHDKLKETGKTTMLRSSYDKPLAELGERKEDLEAESLTKKLLLLQSGVPIEKEELLIEKPTSIINILCQKKDEITKKSEDMPQQGYISADNKFFIDGPIDESKSYFLAIKDSTPWHFHQDIEMLETKGGPAIYFNHPTRRDIYNHILAQNRNYYNHSFVIAKEGIYEISMEPETITDNETEFNTLPKDLNELIWDLDDVTWKQDEKQYHYLKGLFSIREKDFIEWDTLQKAVNHFITTYRRYGILITFTPAAKCSPSIPEKKIKIFSPKKRNSPLQMMCDARKSLSQQSFNYEKPLEGYISLDGTFHTSTVADEESIVPRENKILAQWHLHPSQTDYVISKTGETFYPPTLRDIFTHIVGQVRSYYDNSFVVAKEGLYQITIQPDNIEKITDEIKKLPADPYNIGVFPTRMDFSKEGFNWVSKEEDYPYLAKLFEIPQILFYKANNFEEALTNFIDRYVTHSIVITFTPDKDCAKLE